MVSVYNTTRRIKGYGPHVHLMGPDLNGNIFAIEGENYKVYCEDNINFNLSGCVTKTTHEYSLSLKDGFNKLFASHFSRFLLVINDKCTGIIKNSN